MAYLLHLETSLNISSVAIAKDARLLSLSESKIDKSHSKEIMGLIDSALQEAQLNASDLNAIVVSQGPGSYTGLRIGASVAKGLAYALDIPIIGVSTLDSLVEGAKAQLKAPELLLCPMIDARRMEVYSQVVNMKGEVIVSPGAFIIDESSFHDLGNDDAVWFFGNGAAKCEGVIANDNFNYLNGIDVSAVNMLCIGFQKFKNKAFENTVYFEPDYLKEFQTTTPKKNLLNL